MLDIVHMKGIESVALHATSEVLDLQPDRLNIKLTLNGGNFKCIYIYIYVDKDPGIFLFFLCGDIFAP